MLALERASDPALSRPYPFDVLGAQTQGMIGYWLVQALHGAVPGQPAGCLTARRWSVPTTPLRQPDQVRRAGLRRGAGAAAGRRARVGRPPGRAGWRRVVPSPEPVELVELDLIRLLAGSGVIVVCDGGGGIPVVRDDTGGLRGVEAVVDKDLTAALLAQDRRRTRWSS